MNKVHISDLIFYKKDKEEIIEILKKENIKKLEFFIEPLDEDYTEKMLYVLENYRFDSISFHGPFRKCNLAVLTDESWQDTLKSYEESFKMVVKYSPKFMVLHSNEWIPNNEITSLLKEKILEKINKLVI